MHREGGGAGDVEGWVVDVEGGAAGVILTSCRVRSKGF